MIVSGFVKNIYTIEMYNFRASTHYEILERLYKTHLSEYFKFGKLYGKGV